jgi:FkbH-like protein
MTAPTLSTTLHWLPEPDDFAGGLRAFRSSPSSDGARALAGTRLDFLATAKLDRAVAEAGPLDGLQPFRLAVLATHTADHLLPAIRVAGLRRGLAVEVWLAPYGQVRQAALDPSAGLDAFRPDAALILTDAAAVLPPAPLDAPAREAEAAALAEADGLAGLWGAIRERTRAVPIQATLLPTPEPLFGEAEALVPASPRELLHAVNDRLRRAAREEGALLLDLDRDAARIGVDAVHDPRFWLHARQLVAPAAGPWFGERIGRVLGAVRGLSRKVLVLDLDNTLWGGVVGDDGVAGLALGPGSAAGEAHAAFQAYAGRLRERGVLLAVSSKNDRATAEAPFREHPETVLRLEDFAAFEADWNDKPSALRRIADDLSLGLDAMVFFDDNPVERALVRQTLPQVAVPEAPEDPSLYARCLSDAGYFETVAFTADDAARADQYARNAERRRLAAAATDLDGFLGELGMRLAVRRVDGADLPRVAQLINKTNQFNLTTRRRTEAEVAALADDPGVLAVSVRLTDRFGDNGVVAVAVGLDDELPDGRRALLLDTLLMSCRVLGRKAEDALVHLLADAAAARGADALVGLYRPTARNGMVAGLYPRLGFEPLPLDRLPPAHPPGGAGPDDTAWILPAGRRPPGDPLRFFLEVTAP